AIRLGLKQLLMRRGIAENIAAGITRTAPIFLIALTILLAWIFQWQTQGVKIVGMIPQGLPPFTLPLWDMALWKELALPALLISVVGFVESVSIGQTLAAQRRQRIEPNQELVALGAGNISASFTGGFPVTGGFARSVVNFDAGAQTPAAGAFAAIGIMLSALLLTPALYYLPQAILSATIMVAVLSLADLAILKKTWAYSKSDFAAVAATLLVTLLVGVEAGLLAGIGISLALFIFRTSQPHIATIGLVPGTEHFRNVLRHDVLVSPRVISLRVDGSLYFANARSLEDRINQTIADNPKIQHLLLQCSAINDIDASALASLESLNQQLREAGITLHLTEIKGPVMDKLQQTRFLRDLSGKIFLTHYQAIHELAPEMGQINYRS
ncbi:MAG: SulP family inorganic anion transporter, partial [Candidatus Nitrotoga sp.]